MRTKQMSIYGVKSVDKNTTNGVGLFYNTKNLKVKVEESDTSFKTGVILQFHPFQTPMYVNIGANYIDQNIQEYNSISNHVSQYSNAIAVGYMLYNDLYLEFGENTSRLDGYQISIDDKVNSQITKDTYIQIAKRIETPIGTIDTNINSNQLYNTLAKKEKNYETSFNYSLYDAMNIGYFYNTNQEKTCTGYSMNLSYFTTEYTKNISQDSYNVTVGIKANFTDITKLSTYKAPKRGKKYLSKSHKFDTIVLHDNMHLRKK